MALGEPYPSAEMVGDLAKDVMQILLQYLVIAKLTPVTTADRWEAGSREDDGRGGDRRIGGLAEGTLRGARGFWGDFGTIRLKAG